jgi:hypothetical protein
VGRWGGGGAQSKGQKESKGKYKRRVGGEKKRERSLLTINK